MIAWICLNLCARNTKPNKMLDLLQKSQVAEQPPELLLMAGLLTLMVHSSVALIVTFSICTTAIKCARIIADGLVESKKEKQPEVKLVTQHTN